VPGWFLLSVTKSLVVLCSSLNEKRARHGRKKRVFFIIELDDRVNFIYIFVMVQVVILSATVVNFQYCGGAGPMKNFPSDIRALVASSFE